MRRRRGQDCFHRDGQDARRRNMRSASPTVVWFRNDLRLADNPALLHALERGPVVPLYILDDDGPPRRLGGASRWWLDKSLRALADEIGRRGGALILRRGDSGAVLREVVRACGAAAVVWNRLYDQASIARDREIEAALERGRRGVLDVQRLPAQRADGGGHPQRRLQGLHRLLEEPPRHASKPVRTAPPRRSRRRTNSLPRSRWRAGACIRRIPTGQAALSIGGRGKPARASGSIGFSMQRRRPTPAGATPWPRKASRVSRRTCISARSDPGRCGRPSTMRSNAARFRGAKARATNGSSVGGSSIPPCLFHHPEMPKRALNPTFDALPWSRDKGLSRRWREGQTGYPVVDAATPPALDQRLDAQPRPA